MMNINKLYPMLSSSFKGYKVFALATLMFALLSCSKDKQADKDLLSATNTANQIGYVLKGRAIKFNDQYYSSTKEFLRVALQLNDEAKSGDTVFASVNTALVADYNKKYSENNLSIPPGAFTASNNGVFPVKANARQATDSLYVLLTNASLLKDKTVYLIPVQLTTKSGAATKYAVVYFKMSIIVGQLTGNFVTAGVQLYKFPSYLFNSLRLDYDKIQKKEIPTVIKFIAGLNTPFIYNDVSLSVEYGGDSAAVAYGNKLVLNSAPKPFPADTYTITTVPSTVVKGIKNSADSIVVTLKNKEKFLSLTSYILALKIKNVAGSQYSVPPAANDSARAFIRIYTY